MIEWAIDVADKADGYALDVQERVRRLKRLRQGVPFPGASEEEIEAWLAKVLPDVAELGERYRELHAAFSHIQANLNYLTHSLVETVPEIRHAQAAALRVRQMHES